MGPPKGPDRGGGAGLTPGEFRLAEKRGGKRNRPILRGKRRNRSFPRKKAESPIFPRKRAECVPCFQSLGRAPGKTLSGRRIFDGGMAVKGRNGGKNGGIHGGIGRFGWRNGGAESTMPDGGIPRGQGGGLINFRTPGAL